MQPQTWAAVPHANVTLKDSAQVARGSKETKHSSLSFPLLEKNLRCVLSWLS